MNRWIWNDIGESLRGRPGRTLLALLALSIGTLALTVLMSTVIGLSIKSRAITSEFGADVLAVLSSGKNAPNRTGLLRKHVDFLRANLPDHRLTGVRRDRVTAPEWQRPITVLSVDAELMQVRPWALETGRALDPRDVDERRLYGLISERLSRDHGLKVNDHLRIHPYSFQIVGIVRAAGKALREASPSLAAGAEFLAIPHSVMPAWDLSPTPHNDRVDTLYVKYPAGRDAETTIEKIRGFLAPQERQIGPLSFISEETLIRGISRLQRTIELTSGSIAVLCLLLGGTTLMSLMIANVRERIGEIGLRVALGASEFDIYSLFMLEALVTTGLAALFGSGAAFLLLSGIRDWITFPTHIGPAVFVIPVAVVLVLGVVFSFWPARYAARISPSEALRNE